MFGTHLETVKARLAAAKISYSRLFVVEPQLNVFELQQDYARIGYPGIMGKYGLKVLSAYSEQFTDLDDRRRWRAIIRFTLKPLEPTYQPVILHPSALHLPLPIMSKERAEYDELSQDQLNRAIEKFSENTFTAPEAKYKFARAWQAMTDANESDDTPEALRQARIDNDLTPEALIYVEQMLSFVEGLLR